MEKQAYPVFFILTKHKAKVVYDKIFNIIKNLGVRVRLFMSDYEKATRSSFRSVFEGITIKGCWFHYCQSLVKKVKDLKFGKEYTTNTEINELIRLFFSLAFVPPENINDYYEEIKNKIKTISDEKLKDKMDQFCQYFTTTWIEDTYHVEDWNQLNDLELRSNNWSESFNALFAKRFAKSHPNIYHLLTVIQDICNYYKYMAR